MLCLYLITDWLVTWYRDTESETKTQDNANF